MYGYITKNPNHSPEQLLKYYYIKKFQLEFFFYFIFLLPDRDKMQRGFSNKINRAQIQYLVPQLFNMCAKYFFIYFQTSRQNIQLSTYHYIRHTDHKSLHIFSTNLLVLIQYHESSAQIVIDSRSNSMVFKLILPEGNTVLIMKQQY